MIWIEYDYVCNENLGITLHKKVEYNEKNLAIAQQEAIDGNYTLTEDDETAGIQPIPIELGGTGAKTAEEARENLGIVEYSPVLNISTAKNTLTADMLGKTVMCRVTGEDFSLTISKEVHDTLPVGFELALVYWNAANSVKVYFTGGVSACIAGEGGIENATIALPERYSMIALKKCTSQSWLVTGSVEVV